MNTIKVIDLIKNGLSETNGLILRENIKKILESGEEKIKLDFSYINLFATPFFNSFIGYFVLEYGPKKVDEMLELINISDLGKETFNHSYNNAKNIYNKKTDTSVIGKITQNNITNS